MTDPRSEYFARVVPLLGRGLRGKAVRVEGGTEAWPLVDMLTGCMLDTVVTDAPDALRAHLQWKNPWDTPSVLAAGTADATVEVRLGPVASVRVHALERRMALDLPAEDPFTASDVLWHGAYLTRELLLGRTAWADVQFHLGDPRWPFAPVGNPVVPEAAERPTGHIMVVGCGSVGSEAIGWLTPHAHLWTLVDDGVVSVFNLPRQWFGAAEVGHHKVVALASRLGPGTCAVPEKMDDPEVFRALLRERTPDVVLLATGTHHAGTLSKVLWEERIPYVVASCYPQARYAEVNVIHPARGTPCHHCFRGHLYAGTPATAPMTDDVAQFVYAQPTDASRTRAYEDLVAEPATHVETFRAATLAARCTSALLASTPPLWLSRMFTDGTTVLLGAAAVAHAEDGSPAYGLTRPGQVVRLGLPDLTGDTDERTCGVCAAHLHVPLAQALPTLDSAAEEEAMLRATAT